MHSTDPARTTPPSDDADRAARIEKLLVSGLDHYFAAEYEQAINIWTRVVFLERDHDRARAYIARARSAIAERQRESEELLQRGVDAYNAGDAKRARDLLTRAVDERAPGEEALVLLERLDRLQGVGFDAPLYRSLPSRPSAATAQSDAASHPWRWVLAAAAALLVVIAMALGGVPTLSWFTDPTPVLVPAPQARAEPLPVVRTADLLLDRAKRLYSGGHLHDALHLLDRIGSADPARADADHLRTAIQRDLLTAAYAGVAVSPTGAPQP